MTLPPVIPAKSPKSPKRRRHVELLPCKNGKPLQMLTRDAAFHRPDSVALRRSESTYTEYARGFTRGEVSA